MLSFVPFSFSSTAHPRHWEKNNHHILDHSFPRRQMLYRPVQSLLHQCYCMQSCLQYHHSRSHHLHSRFHLHLPHLQHYLQLLGHHRNYPHGRHLRILNHWEQCMNEVHAGHQEVGLQ